MNSSESIAAPRTAALGARSIHGRLRRTWYSSASPNSAQLNATASVVAFSCAELGEALLYHVLRKRPWIERAPKAAVLGAAIDSLLFITIAFGFSLSTSFAQFAAKLAGALVW